MSYSIQELATLAGISVRTLYHYDEIGLLVPKRDLHNGYRVYSDQDISRLQDILILRNLEIGLQEIKSIIDAPTFKKIDFLETFIKRAENKKREAEQLVTTITKTIRHLKNNIYMDDKDLYEGLQEDKIDVIKTETKDRWGDTDAYAESVTRTSNMSKEDWRVYKERQNKLMQDLATKMPLGHDHPKVQVLIQVHYDSLRMFYTPSKEIYLGLAELYITDERFGSYFEKYALGLALFMNKAMKEFVRRM